MIPKRLLFIVVLLLGHSLLFGQQNNDCLAFQDKSEQSGWQRWVTTSTVLLQYTDSAARSHLNGQQQWTVAVGLSYVASGHYFLKATITLRLSPFEPFPPILQAETPFHFYFLNETDVTLKTLTRSVPMRVDKTSTYRYDVDFILPKQAVKKLRSKELDQLKLSWKDQLLVFELYDVDFFKRHFDCLDAHL